ncbi:Vegetative incompatibility protein HET-E-1 [Trametes pubescens]|uniref:Vegetative incompatibility protein HET-E-1 n=1 Tax=Trametes pubescens TaxID=154538 RepID=A0A1M2V4Y0_TRAPU|nr:Vegetative incompatibility protein HET-E-1 [Trametes pubescens]
MRLLNTTTKRFHRFEDPRSVSYAILSHVWAKPGDGGPPEQSYHELLAIQARFSNGPVDERLLSQKIRMFCKVAAADGFQFVWLDFGCIDQSSSAELSEAINSMYEWYRYADVCYAYLADVGCPGAGAHPLIPPTQFWDSVYFRRGWTLQELIAPNVVIFLSAKWTVIGTKHSLAAVIERATRIDAAILTHRRTLDTVSVARRMSWAARRETTKPEDEAYCLLGIFGVHMQPMYGEGSYAFVRLQEEICRNIPDQTIFAWGGALSREDRFAFSKVVHPSGQRKPARRDSARSASIDSQKQYLFASSPKAFKKSGHLVPISARRLARRLGLREAEHPIYTTTPYGVHTRLPLVLASSESLTSQTFLALLACEDEKGNLVALLLRSQNPESTSESAHTKFVVGTVGRAEDVMRADDSRTQNVVLTLVSHYFRIVTLPFEELQQGLQCVSASDVYIHSRSPRAIHDADRDRQIRSALYKTMMPITLRLAPWCRSVLRRQGYRVETMSGHTHARNTSGSELQLQILPGMPPQRLRISAPNGHVVLSIGRCTCQYGQDYGFISVAILEGHEATHLAIQRAMSADHNMDHPEHVSSWAHHAGYVSKELSSKTSGGLERSLRLCLGRGMPGAGGNVPAAAVDGGAGLSLVLSVEIQQPGCDAALGREMNDAGDEDEDTSEGDSSSESDGSDGDSENEEGGRWGLGDLSRALYRRQ